MDNRYNCHNRRKYSLKVHIVLVTKYRKQLLKDSIAVDVKQRIYNICNSRKYSVIVMETYAFALRLLPIDSICIIVYNGMCLYQFLLYPKILVLKTSFQ